MAATQTTTVETVTVIRPLKVLSLFFLILAIAASILALATTSWLKSGSFSTGLFKECTDKAEPSHGPPLPAAPVPGTCHGVARDSGYLKAVAGLMITGLILTAIVFTCNVCGLSNSDVRRKYKWYKGATMISILALLLELIALVMFPVAFYVRMNDYGSRRDWEVDWSYGCAWVSSLFTLGSIICLICDKDHEEVYYKEKTVYNPPPEIA